MHVPTLILPCDIVFLFREHQKEILMLRRFNRLSRNCLAIGIVVFVFTFTSSCTKDNQGKPSPPTPNCPTLLIAQAQFRAVSGPDGKTKQQPGPAVLILKQKTSAGWQEIVIEDPESNVFHKAILFPEDAAPMQILTIGAMDAALKKWLFKDNGWQQKFLWHPVFGGKWNRLRDMEIGDVNGDGNPEIVIATHDQGVVAVAEQKNQEWTIEEIDREPDIFVHEIEIGDVTGDGKNEFFVTPSKPNKAEGGPQPGAVIMYQWDGTNYKKTLVDSFEKTHAKEILATDLSGTGTATLFSVIEAETLVEEGKAVRTAPVKIKKYVFKNGSIRSTVIATIEDSQCRFICAGDVDGDRKTELVASAMTSGIWLLKETREGSWSVTQIDAASSGYEHATCLADIDGDGVKEIIVASDDQGELREYKWNGTAFTKSIISSIPKGRITWNVSYGIFK